MAVIYIIIAPLVCKGGLLQRWGVVGQVGGSGEGWGMCVCVGGGGGVVRIWGYNGSYQRPGSTLVQVSCPR